MQNILKFLQNTHHSAYNSPLLVILLPKNRNIRLYNIEQLGNNCGNPSKEHRPTLPTHTLFQPLYPYPCLMAKTPLFQTRNHPFSFFSHITIPRTPTTTNTPIIVQIVGVENSINSARNGHELLQIAMKIRWVCGEVLRGGELTWVHIDWDNNEVGVFVGFFDEGDMALVEVPHRGYQAYGLSLGSHPPRPSPHLILVSDYLCFSEFHFSHIFLLPWVGEFWFLSVAFGRV